VRHGAKKILLHRREDGPCRRQIRFVGNRGKQLSCLLVHLRNLTSTEVVQIAFHSNCFYICGFLGQHKGLVKRSLVGKFVEADLPDGFLYLSLERKIRRFDYFLNLTPNSPVATEGDRPEFPFSCHCRAREKSCRGENWNTPLPVHSSPNTFEGPAADFDPEPSEFHTRRSKPRFLPRWPPVACTEPRCWKWCCPSRTPPTAE